MGQPPGRANGFILAAARKSLPAGVYDLQGFEPGEDLDEAALGWLLAGYRFDRYADAPAPKAEMIAPKGVDAKKLEIIATAEALSRDLINTPASDMGPDELELAAKKVADEFWRGVFCGSIAGFEGTGLSNDPCCGAGIGPVAPAD